VQRDFELLQLRVQRVHFLARAQIAHCADFDIVASERNIRKCSLRVLFSRLPQSVPIFDVDHLKKCLAIERNRQFFREYLEDHHAGPGIGQVDCRRHFIQVAVNTIGTRIRLAERLHREQTKESRKHSRQPNSAP